MAYNTVTVHSNQPSKEGTTSGAITPGMLINWTTTAGTYLAHGDAGGANAAAMFAVEDDHQGNDLNDAYATATRFLFKHYLPGDKVNALLADGETAVVGSRLESNGDGYLRVVDADTSAGTIALGACKFVALEALDMSGSSLVDPASQRLLIEVI